MTGRLQWWFQNAEGQRLFQHYRYSRNPTVDDPRTKAYGYRCPAEIWRGVVVDWAYKKPAVADSLIYRLPLVLANPDARLVLTEGERDADALLRKGRLASSHHGGAGKFTEAMAESLASHKGPIVLIADNDPAGAYDVCRRYDLLRAVGIPAKRLAVREVVPTHKGADLRDHIEAGYRLRDLRVADLDRLREIAPDQPPTGPGHWNEGSWEWSTTPEEAEQIRNWKPKVVKRK